MAEFVHPFSGMVPSRKLSDRELTRAIRMALAAEEEAVHMYEAMADASDNSLANLCDSSSWAFSPLSARSSGSKDSGTTSSLMTTLPGKPVSNALPLSLKGLEYHPTIIHT